MKRGAWLVLLGVTGTLFAACTVKEAKDVCDPGTTQTCLCPDAPDGVQSCKSNGSGWEVCECGTGGSSGAAGEAGSGGEAGEGGSAGEAGQGGSAGEAGQGGSAGEAGQGGSAGEAGSAGQGGA